MAHTGEMKVDLVFLRKCAPIQINFRISGTSIRQNRLYNDRTERRTKVLYRKIIYLLTHINQVKKKLSAKILQKKI